MVQSHSISYRLQFQLPNASHWLPGVSSHPICRIHHLWSKFKFIKSIHYLILRIVSTPTIPLSLLCCQPSSETAIMPLPLTAASFPKLCKYEKDNGRIMSISWYTTTLRCLHVLAASLSLYIKCRRMRILQQPTTGLFSHPKIATTKIVCQPCVTLIRHPICLNFLLAEAMSNESKSRGNVMKLILHQSGYFSG